MRSMMMEELNFVQQDTAAWKFFVRLSFYFALTITTLGIVFIPGDLWAKGFLGMGLYFSVSSAFSYAKMVRDEYETSKLLNQVNETRTERMLQEFG